MDQLKGSLRFIPLPAVTQFVAGLGSTGRLKLTQGAWSGDITLRNGEVVAARLGGYETGRIALDGLVLGLAEAEFAFADEPVDAAVEPLMGRAELEAYMARLLVERDRLRLPADALSCVPCLIDQPAETSEASQLTIQAGALQLIPALMHGHTLEQIAQRRGMARTLREMATLQAGGLARLEAASGVSQRPAAAVARPAPTLREQAVQRPLRALHPVKTESEPPQARPQRTSWWQQDTRPSEPRPTPIPAPAPRPINPEQTVQLPRPERDQTQPRPLTPPQSPTPPAPRTGWLRGALVSLFVSPKS